MNITSIRSLFAAILFSASAVSPALMSGCATNTSGMEASGKLLVDSNQPELYKSVVINNSSLAGDIEIAGMKNAIVNDMLLVQVSLRSKSKDTVLVQYKFEWFDTRGFEIYSNQAWKPLILYGKESVTVQGLAPDQNAKEFKLKIRAQDDPEQ